MSRRELNNQVEYLVACVGDFARQHRLSPHAAYLFLKKHRGLAFLFDSYDVEHTQSIPPLDLSLCPLCASGEAAPCGKGRSEEANEGRFRGISAALRFSKS